MNFFSRNMVQVEVQEHKVSIATPSHCDVKIGQVHVVRLQDEVTIIYQKVEFLITPYSLSVI